MEISGGEMEDHEDATNEVNVNLAMHYGDDSTSVSEALIKARKTALNKFNEFLAATNINEGRKYDRGTFPVDLVNESLVGRFSGYLREKVNKCETAHAYLSKMKNILEEDFRAQPQLVELFRAPQKWFHKIRGVVSAHYLRKAEETNTAVTDSAPPITEEVRVFEPWLVKLNFV